MGVQGLGLVLGAHSQISSSQEPHEKDVTISSFEQMKTPRHTVKQFAQVHPIGRSDARDSSSTTF